MAARGGWNREETADVARRLQKVTLRAAGSFEGLAGLCEWLGREKPRWRLLAFGKAAGRMMEGPLASGGGTLVRGLVVAGERDGAARGEVGTGGAQHSLGNAEGVGTGEPPVPREGVENEKEGGAGGKVRVLTADHPLATARNVEAAEAVEAFVRGCAGDETLVVLISGGGSAFLASPAEGLGLEDVVGVSELLMRAGATIRELNCVRKHIERLKGGRLAEMCGAREVRVAVVSDVVGDPLDVVSSGPFAPDPTTFADACGVVRRHGLAGRARRVLEFLERGARGEMAETPKGGAAFSRVRHEVVLSNATVVARVGQAVREMIPSARIEVRTGIEGEGARIGRELAEEMVRLGREVMEEGEAPTAAADGGTSPLGEDRGASFALREVVACVVWGGEWTVSVGESKGRGGPSQELALAAAEGLGLLGSRAMVWAFSTDGRDGPTDAAGAMVDGGTWGEARERGLSPETALCEHDSYGLFEAMGRLVKTGATGTNVNHVVVGMVRRFGS